MSFASQATASNCNGNWQAASAPTGCRYSAAAKGFVSMHPGGANFCLADASVRFIAQSIDYNLYRGLLADLTNGNILNGNVDSCTRYQGATNTATNLPPTNAAIEIVREGKSYKTITDPGGLYGFAGLCAGEYAMTLTPAGAGAIKNPNRVKLDGAASVKVDLPYR